VEREKQLLERIATLEAEVFCLKEFISRFDIKQISGNLVINITNPQEDLQLTVSEIGKDLNIGVKSGDIHFETGDVGYNVSVGAENGDIYVSLAEVHGTIARK
jgi:hypothetical protein